MQNWTLIPFDLGFGLVFTFYLIIILYSGDNQKVTTKRIDDLSKTTLDILDGLEDTLYNAPLFELYNKIQQKVTTTVDGKRAPDYSIEYKYGHGAKRKNVTRNLFELFRLISNAVDYEEYFIYVNKEFGDTPLSTALIWAGFKVIREGKFKIDIKLIIKIFRKTLNCSISVGIGDWLYVD